MEEITNREQLEFILKNEIDYLKRRNSILTDDNNKLINLVADFKKCLIVFQNYPNNIKLMEKKINEINEVVEMERKSKDRLSQNYETKLKENEEKQNEQLKSQQETIEKLQSILDHFQTDLNYQSLNHQNDIQNYQTQMEEIQQKNSEKERRFKEIYDQKNREIERLQIIVDSKTDECIQLEIKDKELENKLVDQLKLQNQLESSKKLISTQKQTYEKQIEDLKRRIQEYEDTQYSTPKKPSYYPPQSNQSSNNNNNNSGFNSSSSSSNQQRKSHYSSN
ncbi:hypothetical protein DFA_04773 [Cavenderia fasciculata]|uniref:Uncharacterized protein n=1 Tax=Cavenderia fasciculata TaxID=261658 RepID=F4PQI0_CACFS|nr:uncharacterized protein DFA_04773 [Cavenderia fasciculata]EGG22643.1 hypothetical protein DFA_04773 [Cavenderia fasciculata]|eukprot:XP_004360494.1 hypothetical protein DFA_04773 [Cavenderia fasciculata]